MWLHSFACLLFPIMCAIGITSMNPNIQQKSVGVISSTVRRRGQHLRLKVSRHTENSHAAKSVQLYVNPVRVKPPRIMYASKTHLNWKATNTRKVPHTKQCKQQLPSDQNMIVDQTEPGQTLSEETVGRGVRQVDGGYQILQSPSMPANVNETGMDENQRMSYTVSESRCPRPGLLLC